MDRNCVFAAAAVLMLGVTVPRVTFADDAIAHNAIEYFANARQAERRLDFNDAIIWCQKAAELGDANSMYELGGIYFGAHDIPGRRLKDYSKAAAWFGKAADLNHIPAITQLGIMYNADGSLGVPEDHVKAAQLFLKAAQAGDAQAMNNLGVLYGRGSGVPRDINEAVRWWEKAVEIDGKGPAGKAAQSWLDLHNGKPLCVYCPPSIK